MRSCLPRPKFAASTTRLRTPNVPEARRPSQFSACFRSSASWIALMSCDCSRVQDQIVFCRRAGADLKGCSACPRSPGFDPVRHLLFSILDQLCGLSPKRQSPPRKCPGGRSSSLNLIYTSNSHGRLQASTRHLCLSRERRLWRCDPSRDGKRLLSLLRLSDQCVPFSPGRPFGCLFASDVRECRQSIL
jgi:hypothetical protein